MTWRLGFELDSRLAANDLDHKSESQVARKTKSLYNLSLLYIVYTVYIMFWPMQYVRAICSHRISRVQYNVETEKYVQDAIK